MSPQTKGKKSSRGPKKGSKEQAKKKYSKSGTIRQTIIIEKSDTGRKSSFKPEYIEEAFNYCLLGSTDEQLAKFFDVNVSTISRWKLEFPPFQEAIKNGRDIADAKIAAALYNRAKGYTYTEQQAIKYKTGVGTEENVKVITVTKSVPPDPVSMIFWLKNRQKERFRDKIDHAVGGDKDNPIVVQEEKTPEEKIAFARKLAFALAIGAKELEKKEREEKESLRRDNSGVED